MRLASPLSRRNEQLLASAAGAPLDWLQFVAANCILAPPFDQALTRSCQPILNHPPATPATVPAGLLAPWRVGELPRPPAPGWRLWIGLLGPGVVLAGTSIGSGEWLFGPAVSAQYGGTMLWLASISIILQVFCNLMMMRYTVYCGEPIIVGGLRTRPGPRYWIPVYADSGYRLDLAVQRLERGGAVGGGHLGAPAGREQSAHRRHRADRDAIGTRPGFRDLHPVLSCPLIFGGTVYRMLEKIMSIKLVLVLGYLTFMTLFMVSPRVGWEVVTGFFRFGDYPQRADTILVDRHFALIGRGGRHELLDQGNARSPTGTIIGDFRVNGEAKKKDLSDDAASQARPRCNVWPSRCCGPASFIFETATESRRRCLSGRGTVDDGWHPAEFTITDAGGKVAVLSTNSTTCRRNIAPRSSELIAPRGRRAQEPVRLTSVKHGELAAVGLVHAGGVRGHRRLGRIGQHAVFQLHPR